MGQIILYNVTFQPPANAPVLVSLSYREEGAANVIDAGQHHADANGDFMNPVVLNLKDDSWYMVMARLDCNPCFFEKLMYSGKDNPANPCCVPDILEAFVTVSATPVITWVGTAAICLKDNRRVHYNTGYLRYVLRDRLVDGVKDGYTEPNTPGPNFIPDVKNLVACPLPVIAWQGTDPVCVTDAGGNNTGYLHFQNRAETVNGTPTGIVQVNDPGVNYVQDEQNLTACPLPAYTWLGADPTCIKDSTGINTGYLEYGRRIRLVAGLPDGYSEANTQGPNYVQPILDAATCPLPLITWVGDGPVCMKDAAGFNTGFVRYTIRNRMQNGVLDGYSESNTQGPNFVADVFNSGVCPVPVITWLGRDGFCATDAFGANTGMLMYANRERVVNGVPDGYIEPNQQDSNYVPPVQDLANCPLPVTTTVPPTTTTIPPTTVPPLITWQGVAPFCQQQPVCPAGYVLSADGSTCTLEETQAPTISHSNYCLANAPNSNYTEWKSRIYKPGWLQASITSYAPTADVFAEMTTDPYWVNTYGGPGNLGPGIRSAVWIDSDCDGIKNSGVAGEKTTIGFEYNNTGPQRTIYVGIWGDNYFLLKVNQNTIVDTGTGYNDAIYFKIFHIFPVTLAAGMNYFNAVATGDGTPDDAIGMIVYDDTPQAIRDATSDAQLHPLFNSGSLRGTTLDTATCPAGWILDTSVPGAYLCKRITRAASTLVNSGLKEFATRERLLNGVPDGYSEPNTPGPNYIPGVTDLGTCPLPPP